MVEDCALHVQASAISMALDTLMKSNYIYNSNCPKVSSVFYTFLQYYVFKIEGKPTPKAQKLWIDVSKCQI